jgi:AcrR family transcriptional regulator
MSPVPNPRKTSRKAIVAAAVEIIERDRTETLSMRAVARRLGLAPNALYNYFPDRKRLEAALAAEGMRRLHAALKRAIKGAAGAEAVRRCCRAYLRFARSRPALYAMTMKRSLDAPGSLVVKADLRDFFRALFASLEDPRLAKAAAFAAWALLHGMIVLDNENPPADSFSALGAPIAALSRSLTR